MRGAPVRYDFEIAEPLLERRIDKQLEDISLA
jgi:hypothetical protein